MKGDWRAWCRPEKDLSIRGFDVEVSLPDGRHHTVAVEQLDDGFRLTARIASPRELGDLAEPELDMWQRNRAVQLVGFHIDRYDRLIGAALVPGVGLRSDEFVLYLRTLAAECDRLEALLTGVDQE